MNRPAEDSKGFSVLLKLAVLNLNGAEVFRVRGCGGRRLYAAAYEWVPPHQHQNDTDGANRQVLQLHVNTQCPTELQFVSVK